VANGSLGEALENPDLVLGYALPFSKNLETALSYRLFTSHERVDDTHFIYLSVLAAF
jgi:hypothetical protein